MDYESIIKRSWEIVKREKVLWIFGMVLAAFGGGSSSGGNYNGISNFWDKKDKIPPDTGKKVTEVLGSMTSNPGAFISSLFAQIPLSYWIALVIGVLLLILFYVILGIFLRNWATGAIFSLVGRSSLSQDMNLARGSQEGRRTWKRLFLVSLVLKGALVLALLGGLLILGLLLIVIGNPLARVFLLLVGGVLIVVGLVAYLVVTVWEVSAKLVVTIEDYPWQKAIRYGWAITNKFFWDGFVMGLINQGIGCLVGCATIVVLLLLVGIIVIGFLVNRAFGLSLAFILCIPVLVMLLAGVLIQGIYRAFTTTNWALFYQELKKRPDFPKS